MLTLIIVIQTAQHTDNRALQMTLLMQPDLFGQNYDQANQMTSIIPFLLMDNDESNDKSGLMMAMIMQSSQALQDPRIDYNISSWLPSNLSLTNC